MKNRYKLTAVFLAAMLALLSCASGGLPGKTPEAEKITQTETDSRETASEKETNSTEERTESTETDPGTSGEESSDITSSEKETEKETAESTSSEEETEKESTSGKSSKYELYQYAYGDNAYKYLRTINDNYPERITGNGNTDTSSRDACGAFIDREMQSFGYTAEVQSWDHFNGSDTANITSYIYHKAGNSRERVVIGAHYDCADTKGAEDNGSGVSLLLETAQRFADIPTDLSIDFCFFDGEEFRGHAGAYYYLLTCPDKENIVLYINLDCIGSGDKMFAYGGVYEGDVLTKDWGYNMAMDIAGEIGVDLNTIPELEEDVFRAPTRLTSSDHDQFIREGIPYVYFEATAWVDENGTEQYPNGHKAMFYNSTDPAFERTSGQIIHSEFDDLDVLEKLLPGRVRSHLTDYSRILTLMLLYMNRYSPEVYGTG